MYLRNLIAFTAVAVCAVWPQGILLCAGEDGHTEFEIDGAPCCPDETGDCVDCVDTGSPETSAVPAAVALEARLTSCIADLPEPGILADRSSDSPPPTLSPDEQRSAILLI